MAEPPGPAASIRPGAVDPVDDLSVEQLVEELVGVVARLKELHRSLAAEPDPDGGRERELERLLELRARLGERIGKAIVRGVAAGLRVRVEGGAEPLPAPEKAPPAAAASPSPVAAPERLAARAPPPELPAVSRREPRSRPPPAPSPPRETPAAPRRRRPLRQILEELGPPRSLETPAQAAEVVARLLDVSAEADGWLVFPTETQRALVGLTSAMARHLQDETSLLEGPALRALGTWFSLMTRWSMVYKPGFVRGLSRSNPPDRGSWMADWRRWWEELSPSAEPIAPSGFGALGASLLEAGLAPSPRDSAPEPPAVAQPVEAEAPGALTAAAWRELERALVEAGADFEAELRALLDCGVGQRDPRLLDLLSDHRDRVAELRGLKTLKSALKYHREADAPAPPPPPPESAPALPPDWPFFALTRGRSAVVVGGDPRGTDRIREAFGFAEVAWVPIDPRRVEALANRIRSRSAEVVLVLRDFVSHSVADAVIDACKDAQVAYAVVDSGYGVGQLRLAMERYLQGRLARLSAG